MTVMPEPDTRTPLPPQLQALIAQSIAMRTQLDALDAVIQTFAASFLAQMARAAADAEARARASGAGQRLMTFDSPVATPPRVPVAVPTPDVSGDIRPTMAGPTSCALA